MKNDPKTSHRWQNPAPPPGLSIADEVLARGGDGLLARLAREVKEGQETHTPAASVPPQEAVRYSEREWRQRNREGAKDTGDRNRKRKVSRLGPKEDGQYLWAVAAP